MRRNEFGLALAGGGPLGAIYETGVMVALEEALVGLDLANGGGQHVGLVGHCLQGASAREAPEAGQALGLGERVHGEHGQVDPGQLQARGQQLGLQLGEVPLQLLGDLQPASGELGGLLLVLVVVLDDLVGGVGHRVGSRARGRVYPRRPLSGPRTPASRWSGRPRPTPPRRAR